MPISAASADASIGGDAAMKPASDSAITASKRPELVKAYDALRRLENYVGTTAAVKAMLADKMRDGAIRAYAAQSWGSGEPSLKKAWKAGPPIDALRKQLINRRHLVASPSWQNDMQRWKWRAGNNLPAWVSNP